VEEWALRKQNQQELNFDEGCCLLGYDDAVWFLWELTFRKNISPPSWDWKFLSLLRFTARIYLTTDWEDTRIDITMEIPLQEALFSFRRGVHPRCEPKVTPSFSVWIWRRYVSLKLRFLQEPYGVVTSQKTASFGQPFLGNPKRWRGRIWGAYVGGGVRGSAVGWGTLLQAATLQVPLDCARVHHTFLPLWWRSTTQAVGDVFRCRRSPSWLSITCGGLPGGVNPLPKCHSICPSNRICLHKKLP
jgi:hypothetical protein